MKTKRFLVVMIILSMIISCMPGVSANAEPGLLENYDVTDPESAVSVVADDALTFTNNSRAGVTATGMTQSVVFDSEKGKNVMSLAFNEKADTSGKATDVLASLDGLAALLADGSSNTISFDYKVTGVMSGNIAMFFVGAEATDLSDNGTKYPAIGLRGSGGIAAFARPAANRTSWYSYVGEGWVSHDSDNTQWNRLTIVVDGNGTKITAIYINGQESTFKNPNGWGLITDGTTAKGEIDKILFNTEGAVTVENGLAILLDNIKIYEGTPKLADVTGLTSELDLVNDMSNPGFAHMTDGYVMDPVKGAVRKLTFEAKSADTNVRAGLLGFSKFMTDETVNTVAFDYKLSGSSENHVGFFLNDTVEAQYWSKTYASMILGNKESIQLRARPSSNGHDWYSYAENANRYQAMTNNREWNRAVLEINNETGEVKGYVNGEYYGSVSGATTGASNLNTIFFNTKPLVGAGGSDSLNGLSILLDNIAVYPGNVKAEDLPEIEELPDTESFYVEVTGIYDSDGITEIKTPDNMMASSTIIAGIKYYNMTQIEETITCIVGYYDSEGRLIDSKFAEPIKVPEMSKSEVLVEFDTPYDVSDISAVKVFMWDNIITVNPVGNTYFICDDLWKGSGELNDNSAFNLVTTFYEDEKTTRGFAWGATGELEDMAIRYVQKDGEWYGESVIKDATYTEYDGRLYYKVDIENLEPGETYIYKIGDRQDDVWSDFYTFTTEPEDLTEFSFISVTDPQSSVWAGGMEYYKMTLDEAFSDDADAAFMIALGDMVNDGSVQSQWDNYFRAVKGYAESIPHMAVVGNHETRGNELTAGKHFGLHFNNPENGADALGDLTASDVSYEDTKGIVNNIEKTVYSFDYGNAHFAVLNSGTDWSEEGKTQIMTEQAKWLDKDLEETDKKWNIVMVHMSMYPAKTERYDTRDELTAVIDKHGVDLVLSGHDHMVTRTYPMKNGEIATTSNPETVIKGTGVINAILGCAGPKRYDEITQIPSYLAFLKATDKTQPTYSLFNVNDEKISVITKQIDGTVVDSFEIVEE